MKLDFSYMEISAKPLRSSFANKDLAELTAAMNDSAIHTFGWPIAPVMYGSPYKPIAATDGIEARFAEPGHREFWSLKRTGEFYFVGELFENIRRPGYVFIDTRTNRIAEAFLRTGRLYQNLGVPDSEEITFLITHGNIFQKELGVANQDRHLSPGRKCSVESVSSSFSIPLNDFVTESALKVNVYTAVRALSEKFDMLKLDKTSFSDPIVVEFLKGRIF